MLMLVCKALCNSCEKHFGDREEKNELTPGATVESALVPGNGLIGAHLEPPGE